MQVLFPTIKINDRLFLSAKYFRESRRETVDSNRDIIGDPVLRTKDIPRKASEVEYHQGGLHRDAVHCIPCIGWPLGIRLPKIKQSSLNEEIQNLLQYHLVPKCSPGGDPNTEWRVSFCVMEHTLIKTTWTREERLTYALFKCLVKRHVRIPEYITTYHLKTIMYFAHDKLKSGTCSFQTHILAVLDDLLHCLVEGNLQMYFVKNLNLLKDVPEEILLKAAEKVSLLRQSINNLPGHLDLLTKPPTDAEVQLSFCKIIRQHMMVTIRKDLNNGKFVELGDLHANPQTMLSAFGSLICTKPWNLLERNIKEGFISS